MNFEPLALQGACLIRPEPVVDERGYFARNFCTSEFRQHGLATSFAQHSSSFNTARGTLRGLHYLANPYAETKVVRCTRGSIFDVLVDLRADSATYGHWLSFELSADNYLALYIPVGFAHGFITLTDASEVQYLIDKEQVPGHGRALRWDDPDLAIAWPMQPLVISDHDRNASAFRTHKS